MHFVVEEDRKRKVYRTSVIDFKHARVLGSELAMKILKEIGRRPCCAMDIARKLGEHEQKIYYHVRRLEKAGMIRVIGYQKRVGGVAKMYELVSPFISFKILDEPEIVDRKTRIRELSVLRPFVEKGKMNAIIVVGSPDPHGKYGAQASDACCAIDLALFLGTFCTHVDLNYKLDTQVRKEDLKNNLILIGGPKANMVIEKINKKLPIYFDEAREFNIISTFSRKTYAADEVGVVMKIRNPFQRKKYVLILSGKRFKGTRAAVVALIKHTKEMEKGRKVDGGFARIVLGVDVDSDGRIDDVKFLE